MTTKIENYWTEGCMRCPYGGTPKCKVLSRLAELKMLREIILESGLAEKMKWGIPVYTHKDKNVVNIFALKESANIGFFKGALLHDPHKILQKQGNVQSGRIIKFNNVEEIIALKEILKMFLSDAIAAEESGKKVELTKNPEPMPEELLQEFEQDPAFETAFFALTLGRQRGYIIHFSQPKQAQTRIGRIQKCKSLIFSGKGLNDIKPTSSR
jgi:uncharacterized protein YdeI (YjbR/CyaY-like superfamily)